MGTAGTAVFFSALTVIIALVGLSVVDISAITQMGIAAAAAVAIAMLLALTLTPALLGISGRHLLSRRARCRQREGRLKPAERLAQSWVRQIRRMPLLYVIAVVVVLAVLAAPVTHLRLGLPNDGDQPSNTSARHAYDLMSTGFGPGFNGPIALLVTYSVTPTSPEVASPVQRLNGIPDVPRVVPSGLHGDDVLVNVIPNSGPSAAATETVVQRLRETSTKAGLPGSPTILVSGQTAINIDDSQHLQSALLPFSPSSSGLPSCCCSSSSARS